MKKLTYILLTLCLTLYSCGMTDVWKEWENEGNMGPDRLKPSEVRKTLCAVDGWKTSYKGHICYFQFDANGVVTTNTDKTILEDKVEGEYYLDFEGEKIVTLTMSGALKNLPDNLEETFIVTLNSDREIVMTGETGALKLNFVSVTTAELKMNETEKEGALALKKKREELVRNGSGLFRNDEGKFVVHYAVSAGNDGEGTIRISRLNGKVLEHKDVAMTLDMGDDMATCTLNESTTIGGKLLQHLYYNFTTHKMTSDCAWVLDENKDIIDFYGGSSWKTCKITNYYRHGDAKPELWEELAWNGVGDIELDSRPDRCLVFCPGPSPSVIHYILYPNNWKVKEQADRIYFTRGQPTQPFGKHDSEDISRVETNLSKFLTAFFDEDGFYMFKDRNGSTNYYYFLSPTSDNWFMVDDRP